MCKLSASCTACLKIIPILLYLVYSYGLLSFGIYALSQDSGVHSDSCGSRYHVYKNAVLNVLFWLFVTTGYFLYPGGGEGARARAVTLAIFYFGFGTWGCLTWHTMDGACEHIFHTKFMSIWLFIQIVTVSDLVFCFLFTSHEMFVGKWLGADLTLMPTITCDSSVMLGADSASPNKAVHVPNAYQHAESVYSQVSATPTSPIQSSSDVQSALAQAGLSNRIDLPASPAHLPAPLEYDVMAISP